MTNGNSRRPLYLGMRDGDLAGKPYAHFFNPKMAPLLPQVKDALHHGLVAAPLLPRLADLPRMLEDGDTELEDGFGMQDDGSLHVAVRTPMPDVTPEMIDWWFSWHSAEPQRYKLWHPRAHVSAEWTDPSSKTLPGRAGYVGRTSIIYEYLGSELAHAAISFVPPSELGFQERALQDASKATVVCARIRFAEFPLLIGSMAHHVRKVPGGSEMRSRFFLGGPYARVEKGRLFGEVATRLARIVRPPTEQNGRELLVHCSQEMAHLASFLPRIYAELRDIP